MAAVHLSMALILGIFYYNHLIRIFIKSDFYGQMQNTYLSDLFPDNVLNNPEYAEGGKLTAAGLAKLKESMPHVDFSAFESDPDVNKLPELFKVQTIVNYVRGKLNG